MQKNIPLARSKSWWHQAIRWLALAGVVGPILYVGVFTLAGFLRPGYSPVRQSVSTLSVGTNAWLLNTDAMVFGVLLLAFAIGFFLLMQQVIKRGMLVTCLVLLILSSVGAINTGIFPAASGTAVLHWTLGFLLGLLPLVVVYTIAGWQWRHKSGWQGYGWYSLATALGTVVLILLAFVLLAPRSASGGPVSDIGGLIERMLILVAFAWHVVIGWRLFVLARFRQQADTQ
jgi:hypothetical membrane protein